MFRQQGGNVWNGQRPALWGSDGCAAASTPLLNSLSLSIDWQFVFVDDFLWLLRVRKSGVLGTAILLTLLAFGTPLE